MVLCEVWLFQDPGVGKTYGVEQILEKDSLFDVMGDRPSLYFCQRHHVIRLVYMLHYTSILTKEHCCA